MKVALNLRQALSSVNPPSLPPKSLRRDHNNSTRAIDLHNNAPDPKTARGCQALTVSRSRRSHRPHRTLHSPSPPLTIDVLILCHPRQALRIPRILSLPPIDRSAHQAPAVDHLCCRSRRPRRMERESETSHCGTS